MNGCSTPLALVEPPHYHLGLHFLEVPGLQVLKLVSFFICGCFGIWNLHHLVDGQGVVYPSVLEVRHISLLGL